MSSLLKQVKQRLEEDREYDFMSEFWTDDMLTMFAEVVEVTSEIKDNSI